MLGAFKKSLAISKNQNQKQERKMKNEKRKYRNFKEV